MKEENINIIKVFSPTLIKLLDYINTEIEREPYVPFKTEHATGYYKKYTKLGSRETYENEDNIKRDINKVIGCIMSEEEKKIYEPNEDIKIFCIDNILWIFKYNLLLVCPVLYDFDEEKYKFDFENNFIKKLNENDKIIIDCKVQNRLMVHSEKPLKMPKKDLTTNMLLGAALGGTAGAYIAKNRAEEHNKKVDDYYKNFNNHSSSISYIEKEYSIKIEHENENIYYNRCIYPTPNLYEKLKNIFDVAKSSDNIEKGKEQLQDIDMKLDEEYKKLCKEEKEINEQIDEYVEKKEKLSFLKFKEKKEIDIKIEQLETAITRIERLKEIHEQILKII